jgi:hypothetical protein
VEGNEEVVIITELPHMLRAGRSPCMGRPEQALCRRVTEAAACLHVP